MEGPPCHCPAPECSRYCQELAERLDIRTPDCQVWLDAVCPSKESCLLLCARVCTCYCCSSLAELCGDVSLCPDCGPLQVGLSPSPLPLPCSLAAALALSFLASPMPSLLLSLLSSSYIHCLAHSALPSPPLPSPTVLGLCSARTVTAGTAATVLCACQSAPM